ncbi:MAG: hypothetical protein P8X74_03645 [Reinekea sp.]
MGVILNEKGEVIRSFTGKNGNSTDDRWLFQTQLSESGNVQTAEKNQHAGFASRPPAGSKLIVSKINGSYLISVAEYDGVLNSGLGEGETTVYSSDSGVIAAFINFLSSGIIELNGNADFAVRYTALETAFNQLKSDFDNHTHGGVSSGGASTASPTASTADITPAKVDEVKLP